MSDERAIQRRKAAYAHAVGEALAHVPAADREAILEDLEEHIDDALRALGGSPGPEQLESVLVALGSPEAYAAELQTLPAASEPPRICKMAMLGLSWSLASLFIAVPSLLLIRVSEGEPSVSLGERVFQAFSFLALAGLIGGPVLAGMALTRIRNAGGRLSGVGAAVAGVWLIPLFVLDCIVLGLMASIFGGMGPMGTDLQLLSMLLLLIANAIVLALLIRHQNRSLAAPAPLNPQPGN